MFPRRRGPGKEILWNVRRRPGGMAGACICQVRRCLDVTSRFVPTHYKGSVAILVAMLMTSSAASSPFHLVSVPLAFKATVGAKCFLPFWFPLFTAASEATRAASGAARDPPHVILRDGAHGR